MDERFPQKDGAPSKLDEGSPKRGGAPPNETDDVSVPPRARPKSGRGPLTPCPSRAVEFPHSANPTNDRAHADPPPPLRPPRAGRREIGLEAAAGAGRCLEKEPGRPLRGGGDIGCVLPDAPRPHCANGIVPPPRRRPTGRLYSGGGSRRPKVTATRAHAAGRPRRSE